MEIKSKQLNGYEIFYNLSSEDMKNKKDKAKSSLKNQSSSTPIDTSQSEPMKTSESINQSPNNNSKLKSPESEDFDSNILCLYSYFLLSTCIDSNLNPF